jgi:hypothetical protein
MAKGLRSKVKKRFRTAKRELVNATVEKKRVEESNRKLKLIQEGRIAEVMPKTKKNAFLYPNDADSEFPQHENVKPLDFRSDALPGAKYAASRGRRKFTAEEQQARKIVGVEGPGAIKGALASELQADASMEVDDGDETASLFVEDTAPVENDNIVETVAKAKKEGANVVWQPIKPGKITKSQRTGAAPVAGRKKKMK